MPQDHGWTVVQHSGFGYAGDEDFRRAVETRKLTTKAEADLAARAGGVTFASYAEADRFADQACYPPGTPGLIPACRGTFSSHQVDGLAIYVPAREVTGLWLSLRLTAGWCAVTCDSTWYNHLREAGKPPDWRKNAV